MCPACGSTLAFLGGACAPCDAAAFVAAYEPVPSSGEPPSLTSAVVDVEDAPEPVEAASTAAGTISLAEVYASICYA